MTFNLIYAYMIETIKSSPPSTPLSTASDEVDQLDELHFPSSPNTPPRIYESYDAKIGARIHAPYPTRFNNSRLFWKIDSWYLDRVELVVWVALHLTYCMGKRTYICSTPVYGPLTYA